MEVFTVKRKEKSCGVKIMLYLDPNGGYQSKYLCKNLSNSTYSVCTFPYVSYFTFKKFYVEYLSDAKH